MMRLCEYTQNTTKVLNEAKGTIAYWLMPTTYNGVNRVQFSVVLLGTTRKVVLNEGSPLLNRRLSWSDTLAQKRFFSNPVNAPIS